MNCLAVGGDLGDGDVLLVGDPGVVVGVDGDGDGKDEDEARCSR